MEITWYGLSCFRIREGSTTVVCDPYASSIGLTLPKIRADIVTTSHDRPGHNHVRRVTGDPKVLRGPGEYEIKNVFVTATMTYHHSSDNGGGERNVVFFFDFGDLIVGHMGDMGQVPAQSEIDELNIGEVDVVMVPVGGHTTLDSTRAVEVIGMLEPRLVIPMHYQHSGLAGTVAAQLEPVDRFLKELGVTIPEAQNQLKVTKSSIPEETQVVLLNPAV